MARLYRPSVPVRVRCIVVLRQLGEMWPEQVIEQREAEDVSLGALLGQKRAELASLLGCKVEELRLDHDPPLGQRVRERRGLGRKTRYTPDANDPAHLFYRPHGAQHAGSHLIKTNVRGDHGQHPDRVLIVKARKLERRKAAEKAAGKRRSPMAVPKPPRAEKRTRGAIPGRRSPLSDLRTRPKRSRIEVPVTNVAREPTGTHERRSRWRVALACGHAILVLRETKPHKRTVRCKLCEARAPRIIHRTPMRGT